MQRVIIYFFVAISALLSLTAVAGDGIAWHAYNNQSVSQANRNNTKVILFAMSNSCEFCKSMQRDTFTDPIVIKLITTYFYPVIVHADTDKATAKRFHLVQIPTIIIFNSNGGIEKQYHGYLDSQQLTSILSAESN